MCYALIGRNLKGYILAQKQDNLLSSHGVINQGVIKSRPVGFPLSTVFLNYKLPFLQKLQKSTVIILLPFLKPKLTQFFQIASSGPSALPNPTSSRFEISQSLNHFPEISQQEVEDIIRRMETSFCALDPFPTTLVKANMCV